MNDYFDTFSSLNHMNSAFDFYGREVTVYDADYDFYNSPYKQHTSSIDDYNKNKFNEE